MNTNTDRTYPEDYSDKEISERVRELLDSLDHHDFQENKVMRLYPQVTLGQTELQSRASERSLRASKLISITALTLSVTSMIFSGLVAWSSSRTADQWRLDQLSILAEINHHVSAIAADATATSGTR